MQDDNKLVWQIVIASGVARCAVALKRVSINKSGLSKLTSFRGGAEYNDVRSLVTDFTMGLFFKEV